MTNNSTYDTTYLDTIEDSSRRLKDIAHSLSYLSNSFYTTGNEVIGNQLSAMAIDIDKSVTDINGAVSVEINDRLKTSQESTANMVKACFAGIAITKKETEA